MRFNINFVLLLFCNGLGTLYSSKILLVFSYFGKSHYFQGKALGHGLARAGHDVTMVSAFQDHEKVKGYKEIYLDGIASKSGMDTNFLTCSDNSTTQMMLAFYQAGLNYVELSLGHPKFQELLKSNEKFDIVIVEDLICPPLKAVAWYFNAPLVLFSPFAPLSTFHAMAGNVAPPSYVVNTLQGKPRFMNFWERSSNMYTYLFEMLYEHFILYPKHETIMKKFFPGCPDMATVDKSVALFLINDHESVTAPIPHVPNMVNILGFHIKDKNALPKDLQEDMDAANNGVILFSFGSFVKPAQMDPQVKSAILNSLGKLNQTVLWKTDEVNIPGKPENVKLYKWLPQTDILAHKNCKLFITHAGFMSTIETIYYAVPILAIPFLGDQRTNTIRMMEMGIGLTTELEDITEQKLDFMLHQLLYNNTYQKNIQRRSALLKDRPVKPMDLIVYWVEYVIRHKDLSHMRVAGLELTWYQYLLLDVILAWTVGVLIVLLIICYILKHLLSMFTRTRKLKTN